MNTATLNRSIRWSVRDGGYAFVLTKDCQTYCFKCEVGTRQVAMRMAGHMAANPELDFDWQDAAEVTQLIRDVVPAGATLREVVDSYEAELDPVDDWFFLVTLLAVSGLGWWGIWLVYQYFFGGYGRG